MISSRGRQERVYDGKRGKAGNKFGDLIAWKDKLTKNGRQKWIFATALLLLFFAVSN